MTLWSYSDLWLWTSLGNVWSRLFLLVAFRLVCIELLQRLVHFSPSLGLLTLNAFTASTEIVIPLVAEVLPFKGLTMINRFTQQVKTRLNPSAHIFGILLTRWENTNLSRQIEQGLRNELGDTVFSTKIRKNITIAEAPLESKNITAYAPKSNGAVDYRAFTYELLARLGIAIM